jgi:sterol desaturase/sphingolipid hydroxylase (fatty acid hydroxylase superfamily)
MQEWRTRAIYFGEMAVTWVLAVVLLAWSPVGASDFAALFAGGFVAWTLAEYAVHRFVLHKLAPKEHSLHHAHPDEAVTRIFWQIWICFGLVGLLAGGAFLSGALVAYSWYLFAHHAAHQSPGILPTPLLKHHVSHHKIATQNFGVSTTFWDRIFGTMLK